MGLSSRVFAAVAGALVAAGVLVSVLEMRETQDLRRQLSRGGVGSVASPAVPMAEVPGVPLEPSPEQLMQLGKSIEERDRLHAELTELRAGIKIPTTPRSPQTPTSTAIDPQVITWARAGRGTPAATFESTLRSLVEKEPDSLSTLIAFDEEARNEATKLYSLLPDDMHDDYASPEDLVAELMVANTRPRATELVVLEQTSNGQNETSAKIGLNKDAKGNWRSATFRFQQDPGGWRLMVPALIIDGYRHRVLGTTSLAEVE